ncbi:MAG: hypothetical protein Q9195_001734 [Heterodermia aff. obscurata]
MSAPAGYCSVQQRSQKRPLSIGAVVEKGSAIRNHLKLWQEQQTSKPEVVNLDKLPGFDRSGSIHNSVFQLGQIEAGASSIGDETDLEVEPEPEIDAEGLVEGIALDQHLFKRGDIILNMCVWLYYYERWILTVSRNSPTGQPAMVVRYIANMLQIYTVHRKICMLDPRGVCFAVQGVIPSNELASAMPHFPIDMDMNEAGKPRIENQVVIPRDVASPLIDRMVSLTSLADECYRNNAYRLDHIWEIIRVTKESKVFSLEEIAIEVFQQPSMSTISTAMLWCLNRKLLSDERFLKDPINHRKAPRFTLLSQEPYDDRLTVMKWIRDYQEGQALDTIASIIGETDHEKDSRRSNALYNFVRKAQTVVGKSREVRSLTPTGHLGPSKVQSSPVGVLPPPETEYPQHFNKDEMKILRCLIDWVLTWKLPTYSNCNILGPAVLRATGLYDGFQFGQATGFLFLKELGVITPWESKAIHYYNFPMPGLGVDAALDEMQKLANPSDLVLKDSMEDLRKDWGDMPVFCIDSLGTNDLDDGLSVEAVDDVSSWVHIHVANPSAFIDKDSAIAKYAARLSSSVYLIESVYSMLESDKLRKHCSLAPGCPSITFSARVSFSGDILETKITHGILHNVKKISPETVNRYIYAESNSSEKVQIITVGGEWPAKAEEKDQILTDSEIKALSKLRELGSARRRKRSDALMFLVDSSDPEVDLGKRHPSYDIHSLGRRIVGDPLIAMQLEPYGNIKRAGLVTNAHELVSDLMILAGEVAAKWSAERGLPIAYCGTLQDLKAERKAFESDVMRPAINEHGYVARQHINHYMLLNGRSVFSPVPIEHGFLDLPMYCKTTSPLRRWGDLFTHWQIDAAVRYEANTKRSLVGNTSDHFLPFSYTASAEALKDYDLLARRCNKLQRQSRWHWIIQWFYRAYYHEASLPKILTAFVIRADLNDHIHPVRAVIKEIGIPCELDRNAISRAAGGVEEGDSWEIEIDTVDIYLNMIYASPVRLLERSNIPPYPKRIS